MLKQSKMLSSRAAMMLVRAAENEMLRPHTGLQVQPHKDHKYRDLFSSARAAEGESQGKPGLLIPIVQYHESEYGQEYD